MADRAGLKNLNKTSGAGRRRHRRHGPDRCPAIGQSQSFLIRHR